MILAKSTNGRYVRNLDDFMCSSKMVLLRELEVIDVIHHFRQHLVGVGVFGRVNEISANICSYREWQKVTRPPIDVEVSINCRRVH